MERFRLGAVVCGCLLLAACGGTSARQPSITRATAIRLAGESNSVAAALRSGDSCGAARRARSLRLQVSNAIATGSIPRSLAAAARSSSVRLASGITCAPPPSKPTPAPSCADLDAQKRALEQEKHSPGRHGKGAAAGHRKGELDRQEHALEQQRKACN